MGMGRRGWVSILVPVVVVAATALGGCGSEDKADRGDSEVQEWLDAKGQDQFSSGPVAEYLGYDDAGAAAELGREQAKKQMQAVADCMREQGFEYVAWDPMGGVGIDGFDMYAGLTREQYVKKWGYGISTTIGPDGDPVDDAPGSDFVDDMPEDPNQKIRDGLSPEEQTAYDKALNGDMAGFAEDGPEPVGGSEEDGADGEGSDIDDGSGEDPSAGEGEGDFEMPDFSTMGCMGKAIGTLGDFNQDDMEAMAKAEEEMSERVASDKRVKAAAREYRSCMKAAGYPDLKKPDDAQQSISDRMEEVMDYDDGGLSDDDGSDLDAEDDMGGDSDSGSSDSYPGITVRGGEGGDGPTVDAKALKALQKDERALARAELPCLGAFEVTRQKVRNEAEDRFIEENPELLARLKKSMG